MEKRCELMEFVFTNYGLYLYNPPSAPAVLASRNVQFEKGCKP